MIKLLYPKFWQTRNIWSYALWPLSLIYRFLALCRKLISSQIKLPAKVICVGNITVGGTGKTQVVIWLAKLFTAQKIKFVIISKGYRRDTKQALLVDLMHTYKEIGDEGVMLREYGTVIVAKKIKDVLPLLNNLKAEVIIVDDGMQNPNFHKDLTIAVIDGHRGFGNELLLPAGPLRQDIEEGFNQADIIITIGNINKNLAKTLCSFNLLSKSVFNAKLISDLKLDKSIKYLAFTGIGNPQRFFLLLKNYGLEIVGTMIFPDHHNYSSKDLDFLKSEPLKHRATLITTAKDWVKIPLGKLEVIRFDVELEFLDSLKLKNIIYEKLS